MRVQHLLKELAKATVHIENQTAKDLVNHRATSEEYDVNENLCPHPNCVDTKKYAKKHNLVRHYANRTRTTFQLERPS